MIIYTFVSFWSRYVIPVGNVYCIIFVENHILIMNLYFCILLVNGTSPITSTNNFNKKNIFLKPKNEKREVSAMRICHNHDSPSPKTPPGCPNSQAYI